MTSTNPTVAMWVKFFKDAGIPTALGQDYAVLFSDHRIQKDILGDLTREILADMGIKVMGDVIAILKQAKVVSEQLHREKTSKLIGAKDANSSPKPGTPASRMITHTINSKMSPAKSSQSPAKPAETPVTKSVFSRLGQDTPSSTKQATTGVFRRLGDPVVSSTDKVGELAYQGVLKKTPSPDMRVTSSTPPPKTKKRVSVMDRLGPAKTAKVDGEQAEPSQKIRGKAKTVVLKSAVDRKAQEQSVLRRLGNKRKEGANDSPESEEEAPPRPAAKPKTVTVKVRASSLTESALLKKAKQQLVVKKLRSTPPLSERRLKRTPVLDRLGGKRSAPTTASSSTIPASRPKVKINRNPHNTPDISGYTHVKTTKSVRLRLKAPLANKHRPISSNKVSSTTSAGIFKGGAGASSSVFKRLGH